jgi:hypothetical protein
MKPSIIIASARCSVSELESLLRPMWFGGEQALIFDPLTKELRPVIIDARGAPKTWQA